MFYSIGIKDFDEEWYLADLLKGSGRTDRYFLFMWTEPIQHSHIYTARDRVGSRSNFAGYIILDWMNEAGRTAEEISAARSFLGLDITELSANQKLFVADAEAAGVTINYNYIAPDSFGRKCPAIYPGDVNFKFFSTNAVINFEFRDNSIIRYAHE